MVHAEIGVIGGTGFYSLLDETEEHEVATPFGEPSDKVALGSVAGRQVAFLPRHGRHHQFPAHAVNYRANLWALRSLGVRRVLAPAAVGSLRADLGPGRVVVPDQLVDRTAGRWPLADVLRLWRRARVVRRPVLPGGPHCGAEDRC